MLILHQLRNEAILISLGRIQNLVPGVGLCIAISVLSWLIDQAEVARFSDAGIEAINADIEAIVLAILIGMALRTVWIPSLPSSCSVPRWSFAARKNSALPCWRPAWMRRPSDF